MNLAELAHNRVAQVGAVAVVGVGGYALYKRHQANAGGVPATAGAASGATPANPATLNTVGSDVGAQLGQFGAAQQQALDQFAGQLNNSLAGLQVVESGGPTATTPGAKPIERSTGNRPQSYADFAKGAGVSEQTLLALNPAISRLGSVPAKTTLIVGYQ